MSGLFRTAGLLITSLFLLGNWFSAAVPATGSAEPLPPNPGMPATTAEQPKAGDPHESSPRETGAFVASKAVTNVVQAAATVVVALYVGFQMFVLHQNADASHARSLSNVRPIVGVTLADFQSTADGRFLVHVHLKDDGKSPAIGVRSRETFAPMSQDDDYFSAFAGQTVNGATLPSMETDATLGSRMILPGDGGVLQEDRTSPLLAKEQIETLLSGRQLLTYIGRVIYYDTQGNEYHTDFCYYRLSSDEAKGRAAPCASHNDVL